MVLGKRKFKCIYKMFWHYIFKIMATTCALFVLGYRVRVSVHVDDIVCYLIHFNMATRLLPKVFHPSSSICISNTCGGAIVLDAVFCWTISDKTVFFCDVVPMHTVLAHSKFSRTMAVYVLFP